MHIALDMGLHPWYQTTGFMSWLTYMNLKVSVLYFYGLCQYYFKCAPSLLFLSYYVLSLSNLLKNISQEYQPDFALTPYIWGKKVQNSVTMSNFGRRDDGSHEDYLIDQQIELPIPYGPIDTHHLGPNGTYHLPQHSINPYTAQFSSPYSQRAICPNIQHLASQCSSGPSELSTHDQARLEQQHLPYVTQAQPRYFRSPKYRPLQEALGDEKGLESQESQNENTMLSEPIIPALDGFPDARTFDRLINR